jgi:hypothetical protein
MRILVATVVVVSLAVMPCQSAAQERVTFVPVPAVSFGFGFGVFSMTDVGQPPVCHDLGLVCDPPAQKPTTSSFGGALWLNLANTRRVGAAIEYSGYSHPWAPFVEGRQVTNRPNNIGFLMAGPRMNIPARGVFHPYVKMLVGFASSDRSPGGLAFLIGAGAETASRCNRKNPLLTCVIGIEVSHRRVGSEPSLSGLQSLLRVGIGF